MYPSVSSCRRFLERFADVVGIVAMENGNLSAGQNEALLLILLGASGCSLECHAIHNIALLLSTAADTVFWRREGGGGREG